eukprot:2535038-Amphidinium_carterae.1
MKAHQTQAALDRGTAPAADHHGNGQVNLLANQGTATHGPLDPDAAWTSWADFVNKVYHFWRIVGPLLPVRPNSDPRVMLPAEVPAEPQLLIPLATGLPQA